MNLGLDGLGLRRWLMLLAIAVVLGGAVYIAEASTAVGTPGAQLFDGRQPLLARIAGHEQALPAQAWRCANCHAGTQGLGGALDRSRLTAAQARRGGPASRYDLPAFCRLLRTGVDPAWILIDRAMPRFEIDDRQCEQLWTHLTQG